MPTTIDKYIRMYYICNNQTKHVRLYGSKFTKVMLFGKPMTKSIKIIQLEHLLNTKKAKAVARTKKREYIRSRKIPGRSGFDSG